MKNHFWGMAAFKAVFSIALGCFLFAGNEQLSGQTCATPYAVCSGAPGGYSPLFPSCPLPGWFLAKKPCSSPTYNAWVYISPPVNAARGSNTSNDPNTAGATATKELSEAEVTSNPLFIRANAYAGNTSCTISFDKKPLVLNLTTATAQKEKGKQSRPVSLCSEKCEKPLQWAFTPVNKDNPMDGFYLSVTDKDVRYLSWDEKTGLSLKAKPANPTETEKIAMTWHPGAGEMKKGAVTGYQILTKASIEHGLVINKQTGEVSVERIYTKTGDEKLGAATVALYKASADWQAVWKFADCKPMTTTPTKAQATRIEEQTVQSIIVELKPGVNPDNWVMQYKDIHLRIANRITPDRNLWVINFNPKEISLEQLLLLVKKSPDVVEAQGNKAVNDRG